MNFANFRPSALNSQKFFSITRTFFLTVGQNNFRNKILFFKQKQKKENHCYLKIEENIFGPDNWQQEPSLKHSEKFWANQNYEGDYWVVFLSLVIISR